MARTKNKEIERLKGAVSTTSAAHNDKGAANPEKKKRRKLKKSRDRQCNKEIRKLQRSAKCMVSKAPMQRLCREISQELTPEDPVRFTQESLTKLQEAAEAYVHGLFHDAYKLTCRVGNRQTLKPEEFRFVVAAQDEAKQRFNGCQAAII